MVELWGKKESRAISFWKLTERVLRTEKVVAGLVFEEVNGNGSEGAVHAKLLQSCATL